MGWVKVGETLAVSSLNMLCLGQATHPVDMLLIG